MLTYKEPARELPVRHSVDVLVVGAGPSGIAAAISSARSGAATMLIEQLGSVGGISTSGLMSHWTGSVNSRLYEEILTRSANENEGSAKGVRTNRIDPEKLAYVYNSMLAESGVRVQLYTFGSGVIMEAGKVEGVITESKSGREVILAKIVIDASGDGDIASKSGANFFKGREDDGKMQPATMMFKVGGVDTENAVFLGAFEERYQTKKGELQQLAKQHLPHPAGHVLLYKSTLPGIVTCNMTNCIGVDGTSAADLTKAEIICRNQIKEIVKFLREFVPGYENCFVISSASLIGIRETRHFKGLYSLNEADILSARVFDDWVVKDAFFNFDVHNLTGAGLDKTGTQKEFKQSKGYTIPYRCLVPEKVNGLLLCGRNISGTHIAHSNFRVMPICVGIGEAAGIAAALGCRNDIEIRSVLAADIQKSL